MIGIICVIVCVFFVSIIIGKIMKSKFQFCTIKMEEAENNIEVLLDKKEQLLKKTRPIIKKELKLKSFLEDLENVENESHFQKNEILRNVMNELFKTLEEHEKLMKSEKLISLIDQINQNEDDLIGTIKFYNDSVVSFNALVGSFPSCVVAFFCRYKEKDFYKHEKRETFAILNEQKEG